MQNVFLSFSFNADADSQLADDVQTLLQSHDLATKTGKRLGGQALESAIKAKIEECDALVALLTRRDQKADGTYTTHQWVLDELNYARDQGRETVALVEDVVDIGGMLQAYQYIPYNPDSTHEALLFLSDTIGQWKKTSGKTVIVRLQPEDAAQVADDGGKLSFRLFADGKYGEWEDVEAIPAPGGVLAYIPRVQEASQIQIALEKDGQKWLSKVEPQWLQLTLKRPQ